MPESNRALVTIAKSLAILVIAGVLILVRHVMLAALIGIGLGVVMIPIPGYLQRKFRVPRGLTVGIMAFLILAGAGFFSYFLGSLVVQQLVPVIQKAPAAVQSLQDRITATFRYSPVISNGLQRVNIGSLFQNSIATLVQGANLTAGAVVGFIFIVILSAYTSSSPRRYMDGLLSAFPAYSRDTVLAVMCESASTLRRWFVAQLIDMLIVGVITGVGVLLVGGSNWLLIGAITTVLEFVPYLGPVAAGVTAVLITLTDQPDRALWVLGVFIVVHQLEGHVITPLVLKEGVDLPPVQLLIFVLMMTALFGLLGVFIAPALFAVGRTVYLMTYGKKMDEARRPSLGPRPAARVSLL